MFIKRTILNCSALFILFFHFTYGNSYPSYGPNVRAAVGEVWPKPLSQLNTGHYYGVDPNNFELVAVNENCSLMEKALERYTIIIKNSARGLIRAPETTVKSYIHQIRVNLTKPCESLPHLNMAESYYLRGNGHILSHSIWGILRGLETLSQLLVPMPDGILRIPETEIYDAPRFKYRGLMLDSARHFISKSKILQLLEGMSYNKLNVFHWHITDDSAFPFNSTTFPELSAKGAYSAHSTYSTEDVREIVLFAMQRGIRVVPEFNTPARTASWGASHPEIMTECFGNFEKHLGPLNPTSDFTFIFLFNLFRELRTLFPDEYLHIGVDEMNKACWESNPQIQRYLASKNLTNIDLPYLFLERFSANISSLGWKQMVWQEAMTENIWMKWPAGTIAQIMNDYNINAQYLTTFNYDIIRSQDLNLHVIDTGSDWEKFYLVDPFHFDGNDEQRRRVLGGEACLWSEFINENNVIPTTFPRVSAVAERLWSQIYHSNIDEASPRIEEHNCRMLFRGIESRPANGYGLC